ncbi:hypothetical protein MP228_006925 [Amoeboaphelidium protococcarum]|nr:hypothetical protein MP228_006925 [Amoeboaphelidium protococcarum]
MTSGVEEDVNMNGQCPKYSIQQLCEQNGDSGISLNGDRHMDNGHNNQASYMDMDGGECTPVGNNSNSNSSCNGTLFASPQPLANGGSASHEGYELQAQPQIGRTREEEIAMVLSGMRDSSSCTSPTSEIAGASYPAIPVHSHVPNNVAAGSGGFIQRVTQLPVVNSTLRTVQEVYESSKNSSNVLRYSANTVESGVKTLIDTTIPVLSRLEPQINQLDSFACRQLDRLEKSYPIILEEPAEMYTTGREAIGGTLRKLHPVSFTSSPSISGQDQSLAHQQQQQQQLQQQQQMHRDQHFAGTPSSSSSTTGASVVQKWNHILGEESVKTLRFCIDWLQYATTHIDLQIQSLKQAMVELQQNANGDVSKMNTHLANAIAQLAQSAARVKREVVETLRKVVDVLGKYAGSVLSLEARNTVRGFILSLPTRWNAIMGTAHPHPESLQQQSLFAQAQFNGAPQSGYPPVQCSGNPAEVEATKVLTLANETNHMLRSTMDVFQQSVRTAEYLFPGSTQASASSQQNVRDQKLQENGESESHSLPSNSDALFNRMEE